MMKPQRGTLWLFLALLSANATAGNEQPTPVACGDVLTSSGAYYLASDLTCGAPAVTIAAANVRLDMRGYTISHALPPSGEDDVGIVVAGTRGFVVNGSVSGYGVGILITGDKNTIQAVIAAGNFIGIMLCCDAMKNRIVGNTANDNVSGGGLIGVGIQDWEGTSHNVIKGNTTKGNQAFGILIGDTEPASKRDRVSDNVASYNGDGGILIFGGASDSHILRNETVGNANWGIISASLTDVFPVNNLIHGNTALGNGLADIAEFNSVCANRWKRNTFATEAGEEFGANSTCTD